MYHMSKRKFIAILGVPLLALSLMATPACNHPASTVGAPMVQQSDQIKALQTIHDVAEGLLSVSKAEAQAHDQGLVDAQTHAAFVSARNKAVASLRAANDAALKAGDRATAKQAIQIAADALSGLVKDGTAAIKNPTTKASVLAGIAALQTILEAF